MIKPDQIPDEVAFALLDIYTLWLGDTDQARAAIAAALNAWPDVVDTHPNNIRHLVLQFKEVSDE